MIPEPINRIAQDRPATWEEVRRATSLTPDSIVEHCYTNGTHCEIDSESGGTIRFRADEFEFFAFLSEMEETAPN
jgi:hypothetical protein